jgi:hypothetical protein
MVRTGEAAAARGLGAVGVNPRAVQLELKRQDLSWLSTLTRRFANESKEAEKRTSLGRIAKTRTARSSASSSTRSRSRRGWARASLRSTSRASMGSSSKRPLTGSRASVRARQPIRVGTAGDARTVIFLAWAQRRLKPEEVERIRAIDRTYRHTAAALGLMRAGAERRAAAAGGNKAEARDCGLRRKAA